MVNKNNEISDAENLVEVNRNDFEGYMYAVYKDISGIETLLTSTADHSEIIAYLAEQAAEKMVKTVFIVNNFKHPWTHNIDEMLWDLKNQNVLDVSDDILKAAGRLSNCEASVRYTVAPSITASEAKLAIADCNAIAEMLEKNGYPNKKINY